MLRIWEDFGRIWEGLGRTWAHFGMDFGRIGGRIWRSVDEFENNWGRVSKWDPRAAPRSVSMRGGPHPPACWTTNHIICHSPSVGGFRPFLRRVRGDRRHFCPAPCGDHVLLFFAFFRIFRVFEIILAFFIDFVFELSSSLMNLNCNSQCHAYNSFLYAVNF